jgi:NaMN:DMB phosphoribosyltransferase
MAGAAVELMPVVLIGGIVLSALGLLFAGIGGDRKRPMVPSHR